MTLFLYCITHSSPLCSSLCRLSSSLKKAMIPSKALLLLPWKNTKKVRSPHKEQGHQVELNLLFSLEDSQIWTSIGKLQPKVTLRIYRTLFQVEIGFEMHLSVRLKGPIVHTFLRSLSLLLIHTHTMWEYKRHAYFHWPRSMTLLPIISSDTKWKHLCLSM